MVTVFFTFLFQTDTVAKLFGLGLGVAILIDATVVRMVLVPATMELLGEANWWLPGWLRRTLPELRIDRAAPALGEPAGGPQDEEREPREPALSR